MALNQRKTAQDDAIAIISARRFQAIVVATSGGLVQIQRLDSLTGPDPTFYPARAGLAATLVAGDAVVCDSIGGTVIVDYKYVTS